MRSPPPSPGYDHLAHAMHALDASHPQAKPAGEDLETLLLAHVDVVGARGPSRLTRSNQPGAVRRSSVGLSSGIRS